MRKEIWKDIIGYEGFYQASNLGRIRSLDRVSNYRNNGTAIKKGKILKTYLVRGYIGCRLMVNGQPKNKLVHRLVWEAFNGTIPEGYEINHIDENPINNLLSNLSLITHRDNINWGSRNKRVSEKQKQLMNSKKIIQYDLNKNIIKEWNSSWEIFREKNYSRKSIIGCCNNKYGFKTAYGYVWKYKEQS